jgi:hypothetical protein
MLRWMRIPLGLVLILSVSGGTARAQGWGWGGWGGWGETPQGSIARGYGALAAGVGYGNLQNAEARSINEDTWQRWNQYLYLSNEEATRKYIAKKNYDIAKNKDSYDKIIKRLQDNPTARDVDEGDALNAALDQLSDPRIQGSSLRIAATPIDAKTIGEIPFRYASEGVTIILSSFKGATKWPAALEIARFADDKKNFEEIAEQARKEDEDGEISKQTTARAHDLIASIRGKLDREPLADSRDNQAALRFVKTLAGLVRLMEKPDTQQVLDQLRMVKTTTVGSLIGFMHVYNLRFAAAKTPQQRSIYEQLFPILDNVRDKVLKAADLDNSSTVQADPKHVGDFFDKLDVDNKPDAGKPKDAPKPPAPQE